MSKLKRPEKIQTSINTNGGASTTTSPSLSAKRPPTAGGAPASTGTNGSTQNGSGPRAANRTRRDGPTQLLGRGQRMSSAGLRSGSVVADTVAAQAAYQPRPYVQSDSYILSKYQGCSPSLKIHLHPTHFRFDQQEGTFTYKSPMKVFIEHLRSGTVPHDLLDQLMDAGVVFYEGCLIVEIHDHKSIAATKEAPQGAKPQEKSEPFSIHQWNDYLTPSPWVAFPKQGIAARTANGKDSDDTKIKSATEKDTENSDVANQPEDNPQTKSSTGAKKPKVSTIVLHPTAMSKHIDLVNKSATPAPSSGSSGRRESRQDFTVPMSAILPPTPLLAIPSTPHLGMEPPAKRQKREKMELDGNNVHKVESQIVLATTSALYLDVVEDSKESAALLDALSHPEHSGDIPAPKTRKKTVAEMAAEESAAADIEKYMLTLDERLSSNNGLPGGANATDGEGQTGGGSWEPRFEKFKALENIKIAVIEKKKQEQLNKQKAAERQAAENAAREQRRQEEVAKAKIDEDMRQSQLNKQQQIQAQATNMSARNAMANQAAQQFQRNMAGQNTQMVQGQSGHGHPQPNPGLANGLTPQQQQRLMAAQQSGQLGSMQAASSPIVRNATPHNLSSPMVASNIGAPMQQSNSGMGGSPPRPGSVVQQNHQLNPAVAQAMRAQSSQQSHGGTPRMANATPNMTQAVPRQMNQTPRMSQGSPMAGHMAQTPHMGGQMMNGQMMGMPMNTLQQQQAALAAQQQMHLRAQAHQQAMGSSPNGHPQMLPAQMQAALQRQQLQQQMAQGGNPNMMNTQQIQGNYAAAMAQMRAQHSQGMQNQQQQQFMNQGNMQGMQAMQGINGMTPQMMQALQQQHQGQQQAQPQPNPQMQQQHMLLQRLTQQCQTQKFQQLMANAQQQYGQMVSAEIVNQLRRQAAQHGALEARQKMVTIQANQQQQQQMRQQQLNMQNQMNMQGMQRQQGM